MAGFFAHQEADKKERTDQDISHDLGVEGLKMSLLGDDISKK